MKKPEKERQTKRQMAEPTYEEYIHAPRQHIWTKCYLPDPKCSDKILFKTIETPLADLRMGDIVANHEGWETSDVIALYRIHSVNRKTLTVNDCDQFGTLTIHGRDNRKRVPIHTNFPYHIVDTNYPLTLK